MRTKTAITIQVLIGLACFAAYLRILNNGFIADDFVKLNAVEVLKVNPAYTLHTPPEIFRSTSDIVFILLKSCFGYRSGSFYAFSIALHFLNCLMLRKVLCEFSATESSANTAAICFAVFQAPQEAVMWLAAISEQLVALFVLGTLLLWVRRRFGLSIFCYCIALVSKESAVIVLPLIPVAEYFKGQRFCVRKYLLLLIPTAGFIAAFLFTWSRNYLLSANDYAAGPQAFLLAARTIARLMWPWFFVLLVLLRFDRKQWVSLRSLSLTVILLAISVSPYMFLVYQKTLPSRAVYLASAVLMSATGYLFHQLNRPLIRRSFFITFVGFNILYLWFRKDGQYESRAAPTTQLIAEMHKRKPSPLYIQDFVYRESPEIAYYTTALVPGWQMGMIGIEGWNAKCDTCVVLRWNPSTEKYDEVR